MYAFTTFTKWLGGFDLLNVDAMNIVGRGKIFMSQPKNV